MEVEFDFCMRYIWKSKKCLKIQKGNQKPYIKGKTIYWPKEKLIKTNNGRQNTKQKMAELRNTNPSRYY